MLQSVCTVMLFMLHISPILIGQINLDRICETDQFESGSVTTGLYQAGELLESDASIASDATVIFSAQEEVSLLGDFLVPMGSCFLAENTVCETIMADVIAVTVSGSSGAYQISVTIESPDTGCNQYANWWEVISTDGILLYRRVLGHSHVNEQPFTRSGSVGIAASEEVYIRAWMNPTGYGGKIMKGSVANGFECTVLSSEFAKEVSLQSPLPGNCPF